VRTRHVRQLSVADVRDGDPVLDREFGELPSPRRAGSHLAAAIYGLPVLGVALSFTALCAWAACRGLLHVAVGAAGRLLPCAVSLPGRSRSSPGSVWRLECDRRVGGTRAIAAYYCVGRSPAGADL